MAFLIKSIEPGSGSVAAARALVAKMPGVITPAQSAATSALVAELGKVLPAACRDIDLPTWGSGRSEVAKDGTVTSASFNIFQKGRTEHWGDGFVGNLIFERQPGGSYAIHLEEQGWIPGEMVSVGQTVTAHSLSAEHLRAPLTALFAHGTDVRQSVRNPQGYLVRE